MMRYLLLLVVLTKVCFCQAQTQNITMSGQLIDQKTGDGVPYANLFYVHRDIGVSTDENGYFQLKVESVKPTDSIHISSVGYKNLKLLVINCVNATIKLEPSVVNLREVIIKPHRKKTLLIHPFKTGDFREQHAHIVGPAIHSIYVPYTSSDEEYKFVKEVWVYIKVQTSSTKYALRFFENGEDQQPGKDMLNEPVIVVTKTMIKGIYKLVKTNVEKYKIIVPASGLFVGIENLIIPENSYEIWGSTKISPAKIAYSPAIQIIQEKENWSWIYSGSWQKRQPSKSKAIFNYGIAVLLTD